MENLISIGQIANLLGVSVDTLRRWDRNGQLTAIRRNKKMNSHRYYRLSEVEEFSKTLDAFKLAKKWMIDKKGFEPLSCYYCPNSYIFQSRLSNLERKLSEKGELKYFYPSIVAVAGEIGNNSFDHNIGAWSDIPGIFFSYNIDKREIVLADRGQGILKTLRQVRPRLKNDVQALRVAFTKIISGRSPERRGNGLKYVRKIVNSKRMRLFFQTNSAWLELKGKNPRPKLEIKISNTFLKGCLVKIEF